MNVYAVVTPRAAADHRGDRLVPVAQNRYEFRDSIASLGTAIINQCVERAGGVLVDTGVAVAVRPPAAHHSRGPRWRRSRSSSASTSYWFHRSATAPTWAGPRTCRTTDRGVRGRPARLGHAARFFSFFWPLALIGFDPKWVVSMVAFHLVL